VKACTVKERDKDRNDICKRKATWHQLQYVDTCEGKLRNNKKTQTTIQCIIFQRVLQLLFLWTD